MIALMFTTSSWDGRPVRLHVAAGPAHGPPLLFLHGVMRSWTDFAPLWPAFTPRWHVHAIDHRGHGQSARGERYLVVDYAADVAAFVRERFTQVALFGHSLGALVAAAVAAELPDRVQGIILEDPPAPSLLADVRATPHFAVWSAMQALAGGARPVSDTARALADVVVPTPAGAVRLGDLRDAASLRYIARCLRDVDGAVVTPLLDGRWLEGYDVGALWGGVRCPALLLRGDEVRGGLIGRAEALALVGMMADGTLIDVPGAGHLIHWQDTAAVRLGLGFLESLR
jgi:pimeloyl-ACP methyl ester carboxylesterase